MNSTTGAARCFLTLKIIVIGVEGLVGDVLESTTFLNVEASDVDGRGGGLADCSTIGADGCHPSTFLNSPLIFDFSLS
uniref:Uncharacterized protein n=1 Tax=Romanomermis culicivorax TaxID=13658 RepID=A0A915HEA9_ROMCU